MLYDQLTINNLLKHTVDYYPNKTALIYKERRLTYRELDQRVNQLANGLLNLNLNKDDKVAIFMNNSIEIIEILLACAKTGIIGVPINARYTATEAKYIINQSDSIALFYNETHSRVVNELKTEDIPQIQHFFMVGNNGENGQINYEAFLQAQDMGEVEIDISDSDTWYLGYTSGTTGAPKGAIISHKTRVQDGVYLSIEYGLRPEFNQLMVMPLFHSNAIIFTTASLLLGNTMFIMDKFNPEEVVENIKENELNYASMVPTMYNMILNLTNHDKVRKSLKSMRVLICSSSPLLTVTKDGILDLFANANLHEFYGSSEAGLVTNLRPEDQKRKIRSVGKPMYGTKIKLVDSEGNEVKPGEPGELYSYNASADGYYKMEDKTSESFKDGWFSAGDIARMDGEGYYYIIDRKKDMIISGGENIYPVEIEEVLSKHPSIYEVAVIGIPDNKWGESVHVLVVCRKGTVVTQQEILDYCDNKLAGYKKPKSVEIVPELPKNTTGKILRRVIRDKYWKENEAKI